MNRRNVVLGGGLVLAITLVGLAQARLEAIASTQMVPAPVFQVDPYWPRPIPNGWVYGTVIGVTVDAQDNVYIVHRGVVNTAEDGANADPPLAECCSSAPPVLKFDPAGNLITAWGGPSETGQYVWPASNHGLGIDEEGNLWIGGNGGGDSHVLKFSQDGTFLAQYGEPGQPANSNSMTHFGQVADIEFDFEADEAYLSDGYGNKRVAVLDAATGAIKRYWGAYGNRPVDQPTYRGNRAAGTGWSADQYQEQQFRNPVHCAEPTNDGLVYVCDRPNNRVQVFQKDGTYVREAYYAPATLGDGSTWDIAFSPDPEQSFFYLADGKNSRIRIVDRQTMQEVSTLGTGGRYAGEFQAIHSIDTDSQGNIYATETYEGRRLHKFVYMGIGDAPRHQGAAWPPRTQ
jgi:DNA-binding beta-propeller fold protein YncE